jgi:hypothetical protein
VSHQTIPCQRDGCTTEFTVEDGQESARCPSCGKEHAAPWEQYDGDAAEGGGVRVTVTIDVQPLGGAPR